MDRPVPSTILTRRCRHNQSAVVWASISLVSCWWIASRPFCGNRARALQKEAVLGEAFFPVFRVSHNKNFRTTVRQEGSVSRTWERNNQNVCEGGKESPSLGSSQYLSEVDPGAPKSPDLVDGFCFYAGDLILQEAISRGHKNLLVIVYATSYNTCSINDDNIQM